MKLLSYLPLSAALACVTATAMAEDPDALPRSSPFKDMKIEPDGQLQLWLIPFDQNEPALNDPIVLGDPNMDEGFAVRRARLGFQGQFNEHVRFRFQLGYEAPFTGTEAAKLYPRIEDAYLSFQRGKLPTIEIGVTKVPYGGQQYNSSKSLLLMERAVTSEVLTFSRDVGLTIGGDYHGDNDGNFGLRGFRWWLGFYNGSGTIFGDDNGIGDVADDPTSATNPFGLAEVLRADIALGTRAAPTGENNLGNRSWSDFTLTLGVNGASNRLLETRSVGYGADVGLYAGPLSFNVEALWKTSYPEHTDEGIPEEFDDIRAFGWFVQGGLFVVRDRLQLATRYEWFDGNKELVDVDDLAIFTAGLNYYPYKSDALKMQLNFVRRAERAADIFVANDSLYLGMAAFF